MIKRFTFLIAAIFSLFIAGSAYAGEIDILLQKLVEKGVLTNGEAQQIATETKEQVRKEIVQGKNEILPQWLQQVKLKGDFRLRYEWDKDKAQKDQSRARIRMRLGLESKVNENVKMAVGIATGSTADPRSRNVTLGTDANTTNTPGSAKTIVLDYAYGQYTPFNGFVLTGGKFYNPLWQPHDVFWKGDITPEGAALNFTRKLGPKIDVFMNDMFFWMKNDARTDKETSVTAFQPGLNIAFTDSLNLKSAFTYYLFNAIKGANQFTSGLGSNSVNSQSQYRYNYDSIQPSMELSVRDPLGGIVPYASLFGDYMYNVAMPSDSTGRGAYDVGVKFGVEKVSDAGQWQGKLIYSKVGRDAWLDIFTDSDRYLKGKTNSKAYEAIFEYGLGKNTSLVLDYYADQSLTKAVSGGYLPEQVLQVDWNMKF